MTTLAPAPSSYAPPVQARPEPEAPTPEARPASFDGLPLAADDAPVRELGDYVHEPDGSVIRARLIGDLAIRLEAGMLGQGIAYLTSDTATSSPFATTFRVLERLPMDEKVLKRTMRDRGIGVLEIKKRGVDVDPAAFRKRMALKGDGSATIILTRIAGKHSALLVERVTPAADA